MNASPLRAITRTATLCAVLGAFTTGALAETKGTPAPDISTLCEKEKVQKCRWEGDRHICEWVDGDKCAVYMKGPRLTRALPTIIRKTAQ